MKYALRHEAALPRSCKALALSPDDSVLALTCMDKMLRLYDAATLALRREVPAGSAALHAVAFSPDGRWVTTGGKVHTAYDVATGKKGTSFKGHRHEIRSAAYSPDGARYYTASSENHTPADWSVRAWDAGTGAELARWRCPRQLLSVAVSADGSLVAAGDKEGYVTLFEAATGRARWEVKAAGAPGDEAKIYAVRFAPDGGRVYASGEFLGVPEVSVGTGAVTRTLAPDGGGRAMAVSRDGSLLFLGDAGLGQGAGLVVVGLATGAAVTKNNEAPALPVGLAVSSDGRAVYLADSVLYALTADPAAVPHPHATS